jgi:imidazoleglycerol-phosphate dehydratase/histidinol-phosphatase
MEVNVGGDLSRSTITTVEDTGLALGEAEAGAWRQAARHQPFQLRAADGRVSPPRCALDISAVRTRCSKADFTYQRVGDLSTEMVEHFFRSLSYHGGDAALKTKDARTITTIERNPAACRYAQAIRVR